jgi:vacuolar-type H+-ATPase subunit I/STV1
MADSEYSLIKIFKWFLIKERSIYNELNKLKNGEKILMGLFWCPTKLKDKLFNCIMEIKQRRSIEGLYITEITKFNEDTFVRPSFIETNEFTYPF